MHREHRPSRRVTLTNERHGTSLRTTVDYSFQARSWIIEKRRAPFIKKRLCPMEGCCDALGVVGKQLGLTILDDVVNPYYIVEFEPNML